MEIKINKAILHILDNNSAYPVFSQSELELNEATEDFMAKHIQKIICDDYMKEAQFNENSPFLPLLDNLKADKDFQKASTEIAKRLHDIMRSNINIPNADLLAALVQIENEEHLALIKFNYKEGFTHYVNYNEQGTDNQIIVHKVLFASENQKNDEGAVINLKDLTLRLVEKSYEINGEKTYYFSKMFLGCSANPSQKESLKIVNKAASELGRKYFDDSFHTASELKSALYDSIESCREIDIESVADRVFDHQPEIKEEYLAEIKKAGLPPKIQISSQKPEKQFARQKIKTDNGIELSIPMELYRDKSAIEFITNTDGTTSLVIKNVSRFISK
ncbi:MAG TPA: nucleoid-associated protein [Ruminiclostridium sp.]|jgi:predicted ribonuclease YlaK|nr:nucleoid-associated protein [Ruminiclostridium sp.]